MLMAAFVLYLVALMLGLLEIPTLPKRFKRTVAKPGTEPIQPTTPHDKRTSEIHRIRSRFHSRFV